MIFRSLSCDIFENLAFEDWIFKNFTSIGRNRIYLFWCNDPSIVIGRHQNPWLECNVQHLQSRGIPIARRRSGGGTVYHDSGNVNITVFTSPKDYNRKRSLKWITEMFNNKWKMKLDINHKDDLTFQGYKVSGSASRIARSAAYHHFTLLLRSNLSCMEQYLTQDLAITSKSATRSVPSRVANVFPFVGSSDTNGFPWNDFWNSLADKIYSKEQFQDLIHSVEEVYPLQREAHFSGLKESHKELTDWDWVFGKTPKFEVEGRIFLNDSLIPVKCTVVKGLVEYVQCRSTHLNQELQSNLIGMPLNSIKLQQMTEQRSVIHD